MLDGFIPGSRATFMLDVVFLAMFAVLPAMCWSIYLVKVRRKYALHKTIQIVLGVVLLVTVALFELDMRFYGWEKQANLSPYFDMNEAYYGANLGFYSLCVHLVFAVSTAVLWVFVIVQAVRKFPSPPQPCDYSPTHVRWARLAACDMVATAVTGWLFYYLAFVA